MNPDDVRAAVAIAMVVIGAGIAALWMRRYGRRLLEKLSPAFEFGTCRRVGLLGLAVEGLSRGFTCRYSIEPASQHNPGGASLRLAVNATGRWSAEVVGAGTRLMVSAGILQNLEIGDPDLDQRLRFTADDEGGFRSLLGADHVRAALREVVATENFARVRCRADRMEARWSPRDRRLDEDVENLRRRLEATENLALACGFAPRMGP